MGAISNGLIFLVPGFLETGHQNVFLLAAVTHNIVRFVILQKRYLNFNIAYFYVLVPLIIIVRVTWFSLIFHLTNQDAS